jgi:aspartate/methionine/tyrosine aminotransferase
MEDRGTTRGSFLSERARRLLASPPAPEYLREHFARVTEPYDDAARPAGYISLCIAENRLVWDLLAPKMAACRDVPPRAFCYDVMSGALPFRQRLARFMGRAFLGREFAPEQVAVLAGAGSVLESLFHALADPGDGVLVPTPSYAGFWPDLETRDELVIVPVHTSSADGFRLTTAALDRAVAAAGRPIRALLFTSPDNPLGRVYGAAEVNEVLRWGEAAGVHVVVDEIYALSVFGTRPFVSCAALRPTLGDRIHVVWAFSKDFAASGLRCGVLVSENQAVLTSVDALAEWACCSGDTQFLLGEMIGDDAWVDTYLAGMRARLGAAYRAVAAALEGEAIPFVPAEAGFFLLVDFRCFMTAATWEEEQTLWRRLLDEANVNLTPGAACRIGEPGFMRLCFAGVPTDTAVHAILRMSAVLRGVRRRD